MIFDKIVEEKFDEIRELTVETDHNYLAYCFKGDTTKKRFDDYDDGIELSKKLGSGEIRLEEAKEQENIFKSNFKEISSQCKFKSEEQNCSLENIKFLYKLRKDVIQSFIDYSSIVSEAKHNAKYEERLKILSPKLMLQRLPIALAQVKAGNTSENLLNEIR